MSRTVSTKLPAVHSPTSAPSHSSGPVRAVSASSIGCCSVRATSGGSWSRIAATVRPPLSVCPSRVASAVATMKKGNSAQQREEGEVAGMDEAVVVDAHRDPFEHLERVSVRLQPLGDPGADGGGGRGEMLAPLLRG